MMMELELERTQLNGYDAVLDTTVFQEETLEMIVPDACPDILRVVDTTGSMMLRSKDAKDGRVELSGTIRAAVLYLPDGEDGIRHLDVILPFTCEVEGKDIGPGCNVMAALRLRRADTKMMNPRKVLVRAELAADVTVFSPMTENICCGVSAGEDAGVEQLTETREICLTSCVREKPFSIDNEVSVTGGKPAAAELLNSRVSVVCGESKLIGNKLIFKGSADVTILYRGQDDGIYTMGGEMPFSQIMEVSGVGEGADCELVLTLTGVTLRLDGEEARSVSATVEVLAQAVARELRTVELLVDAYSTTEPLKAQWQEHPMEERLDSGSRSQNSREIWEVGAGVRNVLDCSLTVGQVTKTREGERLILTAQGEVHILYSTEDGSLYALQRPVSVPCPLELAEECRCFCRCENVGEVYASPAAGGIEARFTLEFHYRALARRQVTALCDILPGEEAPREGEQPSLILRMLERGERLWDVAKCYSTTVADIISANELPDESAAMGRLLLIPRKR